MPIPSVSCTQQSISYLVRTGHHPHLVLRDFFLNCNSFLKPNAFDFSQALKASRIAGETAIGQLLHGYAVKLGFASHPFCSTAVLDMYAKRGNMSAARRFFDGVDTKCEALWNTLIDGYARSSNVMQGVMLFDRMLRSDDASPNSFTYTILVKLAADTADIDLTRFLHGRTVQAGFERYKFVGGALVDCYAKQGELNDACRMFWSLRERDHVVWSALLAGFCCNGEPEKGLDLYLKFISEGYRNDPFIYTSVFNLCSDSGNPRFGSQVHCCFTRSGFALDSFVGSALVNMYVNCGMLADAYRSFLETRGKSRVIFSAMVHGFVGDSDHISALGLISEMRRLGMELDSSILNCMLRVYGNLEMLKEGKTLHARIVKTLGKPDLFTGNTLLAMYAKCKDADQAAKLFRAMEIRNEFSWTSLISGFVESERNEEALELFHIMQSSDPVKPSQFTLVAVLQAISKIREIHKGKQIHGYAVKLGFHSHAYIESAMIGMYSKCDCMDDAFQIYSSMVERDSVSWSNMISAYAQHGNGEKALKLFLEHKDGLMEVDESILSSCLSACSTLTELKMGGCIHSFSIKIGFESDSRVGSALIDMYCKCGILGDARQVFNMMKECNVVCYTTMICGYGQHGLGEEALDLFDEMQEVGIEPDSVTYTGVLSACSHLGLVKEGWHYFESMSNEYRLERTINHYACMVDLLGRSGKVSEAENLINMAPFPSKIALWRTLLGACSKHGNVEVGDRIAKILIRSEPDQPSNYVSLSNIYASASLWDHSVEVKNKMQIGSMRKEPGCSWIEVIN